MTGQVLGVKVQKPGEPGHPRGNRRIFVRIDFKGHRKTRVFNSTKGVQEYAAQVEAMLKLGKVANVLTETEPVSAVSPPTFREASERWLAVEAGGIKTNTRDTHGSIPELHLLPIFGARSITDVTVAEVEDW